MKVDETTAQIMKLLISGFTAKEISEQTSISVSMVKKITRQLRISIKAKNNVELACWWKENCKLIV